MEKQTGGTLLFIGLVMCMIGLSGCASTTREMTMFAFDSGEYTVPSQPAFVLESGDRLRISFLATDTNAVRPYNAAGRRFVVEENGSVRLPVLGDVALAGKTEKEAEKILTEKVAGQLREPFVSVRIDNASVAVLGEVAAPQRIYVEQPISLIKALGIAGGMTNNARRDNVMVQRKEGNKVKIYRINLQTDDIFTSPCYYLQKDDVVYVSPLHAVKSSDK